MILEWYLLRAGGLYHCGMGQAIGETVDADSPISVGDSTQVTARYTLTKDSRCDIKPGPRSQALQESGLSLPSQPVTGERVANLARGGDTLAQQIIVEGGEALGVAIASAAMLLDVDLFVIGSSVARAADLLLGPARRTLPTCSYSSVSARTRIEVTELWGDGPILGCGWLARRAL